MTDRNLFFKTAAVIAILLCLWTFAFGPAFANFVAYCLPNAWTWVLIGFGIQLYIWCKLTNAICNYIYKEGWKNEKDSR